MRIHYLSFLILISSLSSLTSTHTLKFSTDNTFTILHLTDLHYGETASDDENSMKLQSELIKRVKPDLVIVTGDAISEYAFHGQPNWLHDSWDKFTQPFSENQVYYAFSMGNHDSQEKITPEQIYELEKASAFSLTSSGSSVSHDNFNYYLPVRSNIKDDHTSAVLWVFDSHSVGCGEDMNSWGCVGDSQVKWYEDHSKELKKTYGSDVHHLGFFHIPLPEYMDLYNDHEFYGHFNEKVSCPLVNTGFFEAIKTAGDIQAVFVGHDHLNDYGGWLDGVELVYGRKMGYAGYGRLIGFQRGARVIKLSESLKDDGTVKVERRHYVIVENPEEEVEDEVQQKEMKRRKGPKQEACVVGGGMESYWMTLLWIGAVIILLVVVGMIVHKMMERHPKYSQTQLSMVPIEMRDEEHADRTHNISNLSNMDKNWAI